MTATDAPSMLLGRALNLAGIVIVAWTAISRATEIAVPVLVLSGIALAAWLASTVIPDRYGRIGVASAILMIVAGGLSSAPTAGLLVVPTVVGVLVLLRSPTRPLWLGLSGALAAAGFVAVGAIFSSVPLLGLTSIEAGVAVATLLGYSRRQFQIAESQARTLAEERVAGREEQARTMVLEQRQTVARDIHDVLAHSLGGLVIQLDAVDALLDAGRSGDAQSRVRDARQLAVTGLVEARRAVDALRTESPSTMVDGAGVAASFDDLVAAHRSLGGAIDFAVSGEPGPLGSVEANALHRALQEALTNSRRHAPAAPVSARLGWEPDSVSLEVVNPVAIPSPVSTGGGHGLSGMAERFEVIPAASLVTGEYDGSFVVSARVPR